MGLKGHGLDGLERSPVTEASRRIQLRQLNNLRWRGCPCRGRWLVHASSEANWLELAIFYFYFLMGATSKTRTPIFCWVPLFWHLWKLRSFAPLNGAMFPWEMQWVQTQWSSPLLFGRRWKGQLPLFTLFAKWRDTPLGRDTFGHPETVMKLLRVMCLLGGVPVLRGMLCAGLCQGVLLFAGHAMIASVAKCWLCLASNDLACREFKEVASTWHVGLGRLLNARFGLWLIS